MELKQKAGSRYRWGIPLLAAVLSMVWEGAAFGLENVSVYKGVFCCVGLSVFYNWLIGWIKGKPGRKPPRTELMLALPMFTFIFLATIPPFPYVRSWTLPAGLALMGYECLALSLGYLNQEKRMQTVCTLRTSATVTGSVAGRVSDRPGKPSMPTYFPVLAYTVEGKRLELRYDNGFPRPMELGRRVDIRYNPQKPEEYCFEDLNEDKAARMAVPFFMVLGTVLFIVAALAVIFRWSV